MTRKINHKNKKIIMNNTSTTNRQKQRKKEKREKEIQDEIAEIRKYLVVGFDRLLQEIRKQ